MRTKTLTLAIVMSALLSGSLQGAPLNIAGLRQATALAKQASELYAEGKEVRAREAQNEARRILSTVFPVGVPIEIPPECPLQRIPHDSDALDITCIARWFPGSSGQVTLFGSEQSKTALIALQDLAKDASFTGVIVPQKGFGISTSTHVNILLQSRFLIRVYASLSSISDNVVEASPTALPGDLSPNEAARLLESGQSVDNGTLIRLLRACSK